MSREHGGACCDREKIPIIGFRRGPHESCPDAADWGCAQAVACRCAGAGKSLMVRVDPGVVDIYVIRPYRTVWRVLVLQRTMETRCPGSWETVHGHIEPGETPEQAAVRELAEE